MRLGGQRGFVSLVQMPELMLRPAEAADGVVIARIQLAAWRATYGDLNPAMVDGLDLERTADNWAQTANCATHRLQLVQCDGTTVGYAFSGPADGEADSVGELDAVYLLPSAQGLGAGRLLVEDALTGLAEAGFAECLLWVAEQNAHARGFTSTSASVPTAAGTSGVDFRSSATAGCYQLRRPDGGRAQVGSCFNTSATGASYINKLFVDVSGTSHWSSPSSRAARPLRCAAHPIPPRAGQGCASPGWRPPPLDSHRGERARAFTPLPPAPRAPRRARRRLGAVATRPAREGRRTRAGRGGADEGRARRPAAPA